MDKNLELFGISYLGEKHPSESCVSSSINKVSAWGKRIAEKGQAILIIHRLRRFPQIRIRKICVHPRNLWIKISTPDFERREQRQVILIIQPSSRSGDLVNADIF